MISPPCGDENSPATYVGCASQEARPGIGWLGVGGSDHCGTGRLSADENDTPLSALGVAYWLFAVPLSSLPGVLP